MWTNQNNIP